MTINALHIKILVFEPVAWIQKACDKRVVVGAKKRHFSYQVQDKVGRMVLTQVVLRQTMALFAYSSQPQWQEKAKYILHAQLFWRQHNLKQRLEIYSMTGWHSWIMTQLQIRALDGSNLNDVSSQALGTKLIIRLPVTFGSRKIKCSD